MNKPRRIRDAAAPARAHRHRSRELWFYPLLAEELRRVRAVYENLHSRPVGPHPDTEHLRRLDIVGRRRQEKFLFLRIIDHVLALLVVWHQHPFPLRRHG